MTVQTIGEQEDLNLILGIVVQAFKTVVLALKTVILALKTAVGLLDENQMGESTERSAFHSSSF